MPNHRPCRRRLPRLFVAIAGLLFLGGTAAEPLVHALVAGPGPASTVAAGQPGDGDGGPDGPHEESDCLLCKASGPVVLTSGGGLVTQVVVSDGRERIGESIGRSPPAFPAVQPRAPPHA